MDDDLIIDQPEYSESDSDSIDDLCGCGAGGSHMKKTIPTRIQNGLYIREGDTGIDKKHVKLFREINIPTKNLVGGKLYVLRETCILQWDDRFDDKMSTRLENDIFNLHAQARTLMESVGWLADSLEATEDEDMSKALWKMLYQNKRLYCPDKKYEKKYMERIMEYISYSQ